MQDFYLYIEGGDWIAIKAAYMIIDISNDIDGSTCALLLDKNVDADGEDLEEWTLGIPAMQGASILFDTAVGISIARND